jgi:hypothetical protein
LVRLRDETIEAAIDAYSWTFPNVDRTVLLRLAEVAAGTFLAGVNEVPVEGQGLGRSRSSPRSRGRLGVRCDLLWARNCCKGSDDRFEDVERRRRCGTHSRRPRGC